MSRSGLYRDTCFCRPPVTSQQAHSRFYHKPAAPRPKVVLLARFGGAASLRGKDEEAGVTVWKRNTSRVSCLSRLLLKAKLPKPSLCLELPLLHVMELLLHLDSLGGSWSE